MNIYEYLNRRSKTFLTILGLLLTVIIGAIDYWTGTDVSFSLFYLIPITLVTWFDGRENGILVAGAGAATWLLAEFLWRSPNVFPAVLFWNMLMRLGFFLIVVYLETRVKGLSSELQELLGQRTDELKKEIAGRQYVEVISRTLTENSPDLIARFDRQLKHLYVNPAAAKAGKYSPDEYIGKTIREAGVPDEEARKWEERIKKAFETGREVDVEDGFETPQGKQYFMTKFVPERAANGAVQSVQSIARDITDRKRAEDELRHEKEFSKVIIDTAQAIVLVLSTDGKIVSFNPYMERISGYRLDEVKGKDWFDQLLPERNRGCTREIFRKAISDIQTRGNIDQILTKDGRELSVEWYDKTLKDNAGKVIGLLSIGQDVTERRQAEKRLQESEEKYRILVENAGEVVLVAQDGKFKFINYRSIDLLGYMPDELIGKPFIDHIHPEDRKLVGERYAQRLKGENPPNNYFFRVVNKAGQTKWVEISAVRIDWQGRPATLNFLTDVTGQKRMEKEMGESEERYRDLFNESRDAIMTLSPEKGFLSGNAATIKLFACKDEKDFTSHSPATLSPEFQPDGAPSMDKAQKMMKLALEKGSHFFEWTHRRADGTDFPATVLLSRLEHGGEANLQATVRDITEEERVKNELKAKIKELEEFFGATVGRENKMIALEREVDDLLKELGRKPKYQ